VGIQNKRKDAEKRLESTERAKRRGKRVGGNDPSKPDTRGKKENKSQDGKRLGKGKKG